MTDNTSGYSIKLTSIGSDAWQLFVTKLDDSSDFTRIVYGITEQVGGSKRTFGILRKLILVPEKNHDQIFVYQFEEYMMKNRRVWIAFQTVKRNKGKRGTDIGTYIALSPAQSKWWTSIGSSTDLEIKPLDLEHFTLLYKQEKSLPNDIVARLEQG